MKNNKKLYQKAKKIILGGNMLFSKNPENILPDQWPTYYTKAKKNFIWSAGKKYTDFMCYVGQNVLGYSNLLIDKEVINCINNCNITTLNCPEEVELSEQLCTLHPWAQFSKFAKTGGEANAIAVRIARAYKNRDKIAFCGYHGWHDWYLSANLSSKSSLNGHLMDGLSPVGVPSQLKNTLIPFKYGDINSLRKIIKNNPDLAAVKMEVARSSLPDVNFLKEVREITSKKNILLIFDECTTGFRRNLGGMHLLTKVNPDILVLGKTMGNGYPITAVLSNGKLLKKSTNCFISSTFWSDRIGFVAALKTIKVMKKTKSWVHLINSGKHLNNEVKNIAKKNDLKISINGYESITYFEIISKNNQEYKTFIAQEMLKNKFLATNLAYMTINHDWKLINDYSKILNNIFAQIRRFEDGEPIKKYLKGPVIRKSFQRLN
jgi:glutamate-1-semialdehyde 2,1-aminomutase